MGTSATYTFESSNEGFVLTGNGDLQKTFDNWLTPTEGRNDFYNWEFINVESWEVLQSINAVGNARILHSKHYPIIQDQINFGELINRVALQQIEITEQTYLKKIFNGELRR